MIGTAVLGGVVLAGLGTIGAGGVLSAGRRTFLAGLTVQAVGAAAVSYTHLTLPTTPYV